MSVTQATATDTAATAPRVLIVDDERYLTSIVSLKLRQAGYEVEVTGDGEEALVAAREAAAAGRGFDVIVTDFQMPIMSGLDLCQQLKAEPATANVPVVMLTARGHEIPPGETDTTNIRSLMAKPFSARELVEKVREILGPAVGTPAAGEGPEANAA